MAMLTQQEEKEFMKELENNYGDKYLKSLQKSLVAILQMAIMQDVYLYYQPTTYKRTYQLIECVNSEIIDGVLYVFVDTRNSYYESVYGFEVTDAVPYYVELGHEARNYTPPASQRYNQFHRYKPARGFLELAQKTIKASYGIDVKIDWNVPIY